MWFVHKGVVLTKDNLVKRRWVGSSGCCFCDQDETIKHLFLDCPLAKLLWRTLHIAFNVNPPMSINTLFGTWRNRVDANIAKHIRIGICALLWAIWNTRNDLIFNGKNYQFFAGYLQSHFLNPYVVVTHSCGLPGAFGYWMQPLGDGGTDYLQPIWMVS